MPKYNKEMEEKIVALFEKGKRNSVISRELKIYRGSLSSRRKEWEKRKQEEEKTETELEKIIQQKQTIDPQKYTRAPNNHRTLSSQIIEVEKRISKLEESQRGAKPYLLKRRISKLEESQRVNMWRINSSITDFSKLRDELIESAERRLTDDDTCKHVNKNGFCLLYYFFNEELEKSEYLKPRGHGDKNGKRVYYINVKEHPLICSACPDYECKS